MKPNEEAPSASETAAADAAARAALVSADALAAITAVGLSHAARLLEPHVTARLAAVHTGDGNYRVVGVDAHGEPRAGARGPMSATEIVRELLDQNPDWLRALRPR